MKRVCALAMVLCASQVMAFTFSEDFNSYAPGTTAWGSGGVWTEPTNDLKLDAYAVSGLAPRVGNHTGTRSADADLGQTLQGPATLAASFYWDHVVARNDGFFVVLADSPATAAMVPDTGSLASPINAIAIGHAMTGSKNYGFFDGQNWYVLGAFSETSGTNHSERLQVTLDGAGNYTWELIAGEPYTSYSAALAVSNFTFNTLSVQSRGGSSGYFSGIDDINLEAVPEPATLALLSVAGLFLRRRR